MLSLQICNDYKSVTIMIDEKIRDHAKRLFIMLNSENKFQYQVPTIAKKLTEKYKTSVSIPVVYMWRNKYNWIEQREEIKKKGLDQYNKKKKAFDAELVNEVADDLEFIYKSEVRLYKATLLEIERKLNNEPTNTEEILRDLEYLRKSAKDTILQLNSVPQQQNVTNVNLNQLDYSQLKELLSNEDTKAIDKE